MMVGVRLRSSGSLFFLMACQENLLQASIYTFAFETISLIL